MSRFALALALAALPALCAANAPPPDRFTPCLGKQAGDPCFEAGCTCVEERQGCPGDAGACLSCERPGNAWCGPTSYSGPGPEGGCSCSTPGAASLAGALGLALLVRRRRRPQAR
jgi:MYXO-CTERM domain-containing protein